MYLVGIPCHVNDFGSTQGHREVHEAQLKTLSLKVLLSTEILSVGTRRKKGVSGFIDYSAESALLAAIDALIVLRYVT
jgi:hypothetical protein